MMILSTCCGHCCPGSWRACRCCCGEGTCRCGWSSLNSFFCGSGFGSCSFFLGCNRWKYPSILVQINRLADSELGLCITQLAVWSFQHLKICMYNLSGLKSNQLDQKFNTTCFMCCHNPQLNKWWFTSVSTVQVISSSILKWKFQNQVLSKSLFCLCMQGV